MERLLCVYFHGKLATGQYPRCGQLEGMMAFRADRDAATSGKSRGGGLCLYINKDWSVNATLVTKHCSQLAQLLII